nr:MAG TPA: hypothetical protein [Caudoviricetes sp.]
MKSIKCREGCSYYILLQVVLWAAFYCWIHK